MGGFYLAYRVLRQRDASKFHAQLCIAILLMLLVFIVGIKRTENLIACTAISTLIQYSTLASAFWMGGEAILMFKKLIIVFGRTTNLFIVLVSLICWGKYQGIGYVRTHAGVNISSYIGYRICAHSLLG